MTKLATLPAADPPRPGILSLYMHDLRVEVLERAALGRPAVGSVGPRPHTILSGTRVSCVRTHIVI